MERLVLGLIAVIGLHVAFVLYMSGIRRAEQSDEIAGGGARPSGQLAVKPGVVPEPPRVVAPSLPESRPIARSSVQADRETSKTPRVGSITGSEITYRRHARSSGIAKTVPAFPSRTSSGPKNVEVTFGDRIILYKKPVSPPGRPLTAAAPARRDDGNRKGKNNSLVAKLQWVYKKPWGLMKAVGSKLR